MSEPFELKAFRFYRNAQDDWIMPILIVPESSCWIYWPAARLVNYTRHPHFTPDRATGDSCQGSSFDLLQVLLDGDYQLTDLMKKSTSFVDKGLVDTLVEAGKDIHRQTMKHGSGSYIHHGTLTGTSRTVTHHV